MTSGPGATGKTDVPPDEAIEEISGLLEMDDLKPASRKPQTVPKRQRLMPRMLPKLPRRCSHVSMETPGAVKLDSYLVPPPVGEEPANGPEPESASATNMAYEDLLEKLVLPAQPAAPDEAEAAEEPPPFASPQSSSAHLSSTPLASIFPPQPAATEERTVVTANPLLAEEQEAAAREAENYILPAAPVEAPAFVESPIVAQPVRAKLQPAGLARASSSRFPTRCSVS